MASRRSYGTGSITPRGKDKWLVRAPWGTDPITLQRRRPSRVVTGSKRDAQAVLDKMTGEKVSGRGAETDASLSSIINTFRATTPHAVGTNRNYDTALEILPDHFKERPAHSINGGMLSDLYLSLQAQGYAVDRIRCLAAVISAAYTSAIKQRRVLTYNPASASIVPAAPTRKRKKGVVDTTVARMFAACETTQERVLIALLAATGGRRSEVGALRWIDVDLGAGQLLIEEALEPINAGKKGRDPMGDRKDTKTSDSRLLPIGPTTVAVLARWHAEMAERAAASGTALHPSALVVSDDPTGLKPRTPGSTTKWVSGLGKTLGLKVSPHTFRHILISVSQDNGIPLAVASQFAGHRSMTTTQGYTQAMPPRAQEIATLMDSLLQPG